MTKKTAKKPAKKTVSAGTGKSMQAAQTKPLVVKKSAYAPSVLAENFRRALIKPDDVSVTRLPGAFQIAQKAWQLLLSRKGVFMRLLGIYFLISFVFIKGFNVGLDAAAVKSDLLSAANNPVGNVSASLAIFTEILRDSGSNLMGTYQFLLFVVISLALVWAFRAAMAKERFTMRDALYKGMYPLIPAITVVFFAVLQLLPFLLSATLYIYVVFGQIAINFIERLPWIILFAAGTWWTIYMLCSSLVAFYVAALPDMPPLKALRSARQLVRYRRMSVLRKLLFIPLALSILLVAIVLPTILIVPVIASWVYYVFGLISVVLVNAYMYVLYRELLN